MQTLTPLDAIPYDIASDFGSELHKAVPCLGGSFRLVKIRRTGTNDWESGKIIVLVIDENGFALPGVKVAFSYSTAHPYGIDDLFQWYPPGPLRAHIVPTEGGGQIEHVQNDPIKENQPGGVTVYVVEPEYSSDYITGCGMLADHTGQHLTFQLRRTGVVTFDERLAAIEARLDALE